MAQPDGRHGRECRAQDRDGLHRAGATVASDYLGRPNVEIEWTNGVFARTDAQSAVTLRELAGFAAGRGQAIDVAATFEHIGQKPFSYGTNAAHVAVDPRTGDVRLIDFIAVEDIGRVINPLVAHGQALGAIVQGLGGVFLEHLVYDDSGQLLTATLADYLLPAATDYPNIRGICVETAPAPGNPPSARKGQAKAGSWRWQPPSAMR